MMTKAAGRLSFALKAAQPFGVAAHLWREQLDRDSIAEQDVARFIDGAHTTLAQQGLDLVLAIQHCTNERSSIFFQNFAVLWTEAERVVKFVLADRAVLHQWISLQRRAVEGRVSYSIRLSRTQPLLRRLRSRRRSGQSSRIPGRASGRDNQRGSRRSRLR